MLAPLKASKGFLSEPFLTRVPSPRVARLRAHLPDGALTGSQQVAWKNLGDSRNKVQVGALKAAAPWVNASKGFKRLQPSMRVVGMDL